MDGIYVYVSIFFFKLIIHILLLFPTICSNQSAREISQFAESAMAVKRVILQHFSMRYDYMKERPNIYQPSQNGVDQNHDFSTFKKNRSTNSKSLLAGVPASRNRSTYGRTSTLSTRQSINKYGSIHGSNGGANVNGGPGGGGLRSLNNSSILNTSAGSRSGGFSMLNIHDENEDDEVLDNSVRITGNIERNGDVTEPKNWRSYYNEDVMQDIEEDRDDEDDGGDNSYHTYWRDLDDYDNDGDYDDVDEEDEDEEDTYHQHQQLQQDNTSFVLSEPDINLQEDSGIIYKSSWITESDDEYNPDYDENEKFINNHNDCHSDDDNYDNDDDDDDEVDYNTTLTELKENKIVQDYCKNDEQNQLDIEEDEEMEEKKLKHKTVEILKSISDLKEMLPDVNDETGNNHNKIDEINRNDDNLKDNENNNDHNREQHDDYGQVIKGDNSFKHINNQNKDDDDENENEALKEQQNDAVPINVPIINVIKCPPKANSLTNNDNDNDDDDDNDDKKKNDDEDEKRKENDKILTSTPQASILKMPKQQEERSSGKVQSPTAQPRSVYFAPDEKEEDYDENYDLYAENEEKLDVFNKPFIYNNNFNNRQYSKYNQDTQKRYITVNQRNQQQQQQQQPIENWRQRNNNSNQQQEQQKNFKNLDNQSYRKYRPNNGAHYGNRNYLGSFSHSGTQQKQQSSNPLPRSNPYMLPNYYHQQHNIRHNSGGGGGSPPSDNEGKSLKSSPNSSNEIRNWRNDCLYSSVRSCNLQNSSPTEQQAYQQRRCFSQQPQMQPLYRVNPQRIGSGRFPSAYLNNTDYNSTPLSIGLSPPSESLLLQRRMQRIHNSNLNASNLSTSPPNPYPPTHYHQQLQRNGNDLLINNSNEYCQQQATASG